MTSFTIEALSDLPSQPGLVTRGTIRGGAVRPGMVLRIRGTLQNVQILGLELTCSAAPRTTRIALILDRDHAPMIRPGTVLVATD